MTTSTDKPVERKDEKLIMDAMQRLMRGRTTFMIAHRLSTVRDCDRLYYLKHGVIEAAGNFDKLRSSHDDFRAMATA